MTEEGLCNGIDYNLKDMYTLEKNISDLIVVIILILLWKRLLRFMMGFVMMQNDIVV